MLYCSINGPHDRIRNDHGVPRHLGRWASGCQAHEYRVFSYQPEIETGCLFQLKRDSSHGAGFGVGQPTNPVSGVMRFNGSGLDFKLSLRTVLFIWVK